MRRKKSMSLLALILSLICVFSSCGESPEKKREAKGEAGGFIIVTSFDGVDVSVGKAAALALTEGGYSVKLYSLEESEPEKKDLERAEAVLTVGREVTKEYLKKELSAPLFYCIADGGGTVGGDAKGIAPTLSSSALGDAAMILLPDARSFTLLSGSEGGSDVKDCCDLFDMAGADYTVEALEGRIYGEVLLSALESDCDAVILPAGGLGSKSSGAAALPYIPESPVPVIAQGHGAPIKGAFATFCVDSPSLGASLAALALGALYGEEAEYPESYFRLCISESRAEGKVDERARKNISEFFEVLYVE